jgi:hypothetical protein
MKIKILQMALMGAGLLAPVTMSISGANRAAQAGEPAAVSAPQAKPSILTAKLTLLNGASRLVTIEGVGCTRSICSRTHIDGKAEQEPSTAAPLQSIAFNAIDAIQNTAPNKALFILKDGGRLQMSLVADFRVLYLLDESGRSQRLDLGEIKSLEFMPKQ